MENKVVDCITKLNKMGCEVSFDDSMGCKPRSFSTDGMIPYEWVKDLDHQLILIRIVYDDIDLYECAIVEKNEIESELELAIEIVTKHIAKWRSEYGNETESC